MYLQQLGTGAKMAIDLPLPLNHTFAETTNKNIIMSSFKSSGDIQRKRVGQTAVSDNQSSSVTLNELANKARKI